MIMYYIDISAQIIFKVLRKNSSSYDLHCGIQYSKIVYSMLPLIIAVFGTIIKVKRWGLSSHIT